LGTAINVSNFIECFSPASRQSGDLDFEAIARRKLPADFSRSPLEILGGPQSSFPHPVGSGALSVDPMPGGKLFQSLDCLQRIFGHRQNLRIRSNMGPSLTELFGRSATTITHIPDDSFSAGSAPNPVSYYEYLLRMTS
jgi:hypothetical protein